ncbi:MAG TPA: thioredoxin domain-containing protein [Candidatus Paceibacterota bacterium]|nr:thioredoxin domain-containing protein [Candidatus Paceibacterota bacterium]
MKIPLVIIFSGMVLAIAVYISLPKNSGQGVPTGNPSLVRPVGIGDHIFGNPVAKVMIVEYADFDCEYCKGFDTVLHEIIADQGATGDVAWVYREFPLVEIHPNAMKHAEAAECAALVGGTDAFWKFSDMLFAHQPVDPTQYGAFVATIGISGNAFASCFANATQTVDARINADRQNALAMGAAGTPYSLILVAGQPPIVMNGAYSYEGVNQLVEQALASAK